MAQFYIEVDGTIVDEAQSRGDALDIVERHFVRQQGYQQAAVNVWTREGVNGVSTVRLVKAKEIITA